MNFSTKFQFYLAGEFNSDKNRGTIISWVSAAIGVASIFQPCKLSCERGCVIKFNLLFMI